MNVDGTHYQSVWFDETSDRICYINQNFLPFRFVTEELISAEGAFRAIREMHIRGAPLIGVVAAFGMYLAVKESGAGTDPWVYIESWAERFTSARPTAINLEAAVNRVLTALQRIPGNTKRLLATRNLALQIMEEEKENCHRIGIYGRELIRELSKARKGKPVNILTHCNAGWLAAVDYGTATAPVYLSHDEGIPVHVWVDETRPRNQGARLTAWELLRHGVPHTVIPDNTGGLLMQKGMVDLVITGADRVTMNSDVVNKIGTYLKALAARDNSVPFYVAAPSSSIDFHNDIPLSEIPIEERDPDEIRFMEGLADGKVQNFRIIPEENPVVNYGFDITPSRLITGIITERGICPANMSALSDLFPGRTS